MRKLFLVATAIGLSLTAGCTAAPPPTPPSGGGLATTGSSTAASRPVPLTTATSGNSLTTPDANATLPSTAPAKPAPTVEAAQEWRRGRMQYGVQVYWHTDSTDLSQDHSDAILDYVVGLGANSVGITFPIYTDGSQPSRVYAGPDTPTDAQISRIVRQARSRNLHVIVRPIIDETNIMTTQGEWRGSLRPRDLDTWFDSYQALLMPYAASAQASGADEFVLGTELFSLEPQTARWQKLLAAAQSAYHGVISYGVNWTSINRRVSPFAAQGVDLYPALNLDDGASVAQLSGALEAFLMQAPANLRAVMTIQEVGIPAISGMYAHPWLWGNTHQPLNLDIQANWFRAACDAAKRAKLQGIYYWMIDSNWIPGQTDPASLPPFSFIGRPAEANIRQCFIVP